jgi:nucleoside triphosphate pyrophosphatase
MSALWLAKAPLVLASKSAARQALLKAAGLPFGVIAADIDERAVEAPLRAKAAPATAIAAHLARAKALAVSAHAESRLVIGADQVLALGDETFAKPESREAARAQLAKLSGRTHALQSAVCVARDGSILFEAISTANMTCRGFSPDFIDRYLAAAGDSVLTSVGAYQVEGLGVHLFDKIDGDQATILGLPLLPLLAFLREEGSLAA